MRALFVFSLALVLVSLPAAQAGACRCGEEGSARSCGCCCAAAGRACSCCPKDDERKPDRLDGACPCTRSAPQAPELPEIQIPAPAAGMETGVAEPATLQSADEQRTLKPRRDPYPEVLLPLLL